MPEDKKQKAKNDPKDQRKRRGRQPINSNEKNLEKEPEVQKNSNTSVPVPDSSEKAANEPPPEFYKNLKRETDEILKITEEANSKYKKKEILSNWSKYEMPIETYDEIDEQENLGADYETLANAPLSVGGHFQFKHEKSWDANTGSSLYDKYFDINMQEFNIALCTIPFFERNGIEQSIFSETDIQNMNLRATKFKQKYYKDKKYNIPEVEVQEKILSALLKPEDTERLSKDTEIEFTTKDCSIKDKNEQSNIKLQNNDKNNKVKELEAQSKHDHNKYHVQNDLKPEHTNSSDTSLLKVNTEITKSNVTKSRKDSDSDNLNELLNDSNEITSKKKISCEEVIANLEKIKPASVPKDEKVVESTKKPVIECPEDLEKWLDDFLDG